jgi:bifunctional DNA-binding transcriptional regulator/antitoxin component of YhaV-PrlF toxin-antitoxin module
MNETLTLTVTAKGQVTLKQSVLRHLGIAPGDTLTVALGPGSAILRAAPRGEISAFFGALPEPPKGSTGVSVEEMNTAIARGWAGRG